MLWRILFVASGVLIIAGGMQHPRGGGMAAMLADPVWVLSHSLLLAGFVCLLAGLLLFRSAGAPAAHAGRWLRPAIWATLLQSIEMAVHTAAIADAEGVAAAGEGASFFSTSTPVFSTHMALSVVAYPIFGLAMAGLVVACARDRVLAPRWLAPLGVLGALAHGASVPLVLLGVPWAGVLFPLLMLLALWIILSGIWPARWGVVPGGV